MSGFQDLSKDKHTTLIRNMTHDIRGALVTMSAMLRLLRLEHYGEVSPGVLVKINDLHSRVNILIGVVEDYVNMTLAFRDNFDIELEEVDLAEKIIDPVLEELTIELEKNEIHYDPRKFGIGDEPVVLRTNEVLLKSVFRNLIKNAIKYGGAGCTIACGAKKQGSYYRLNVYNSGEPLPPADQDKIFEIGYSESDTGLGLGLSMVKKIITAHGGKIYYEACEDGSNFVFTLPR